MNAEQMQGAYQVYAAEHGLAGAAISAALEVLLDKAEVPWRDAHESLNMGMAHWVRRTQVGCYAGDIINESNEIFTAMSPRAAQWLDEAVAHAHGLGGSRARSTNAQCTCPGRRD